MFAGDVGRARPLLAGAAHAHRVTDRVSWRYDQVEPGTLVGSNDDRAGRLPEMAGDGAASLRPEVIAGMRARAIAMRRRTGRRCIF